MFVRERNLSCQWLALLSTDISLSDDEVIRIYDKRWDIESFFKASKSDPPAGEGVTGTYIRHRNRYGNSAVYDSFTQFYQEKLAA
ncbi:hypothetical protein FY534_13255 [Alicyclobacillus sp. TC]|nr:hypothetical protein FY534_13255 [Alicyclobacillus sp. TC]